MPYFWSFLPPLIHRLVALSHKNTSVLKTEVFLWNKERGREANGSDSEWSAGGKSTMPLPGTDEGMALFPQPQLLQGYANADLQKLNAARWFCFNPRRPARRQANPPYLLPAYTLDSRARRSLENSVDPNDDPNADRSGKHRTVFARCFLRLRGFFLSDSCLC